MRTKCYEPATEYGGRYRVRGWPAVAVFVVRPVDAYEALDAGEVVL